MKIHIIQHVSFEEPGAIATWAELRGHEVLVVNPSSGDLLPKPDETDFLILLGGPMSVYDEQQHPWLREEKKALKLFLESEQTPVFGICLGAQLIASLLGAKVFNNDRKEVGWFKTTLNPVGLFQGMPNKTPTFFHWHGETFEQPVGTELLAFSEITKVQAFQKGPRILAVQFHPEMNSETLVVLLKACGSDIDPLTPVQQSVAEIISAQALHLPASETFLYQLLDRMSGQTK